MRVIKPVEIDDSNLTSSTIPEPDASKSEVVWTPGTRLLGQQFISTNTHRVYQVVADPSTTVDPEIGVNTIPPSWVDVGPTNKFAMFDTVNSTQSSETTSLVVELTTGTIVNSVAGFAIDGATALNVTMTDPTEGVVYDRDVEMRDNSDVDSWWSYFFAPIINITEFVLLDLPVFPEATVKVTVTGVSINFGNLVVGNQLVLGVTNYGSSLQLLDFSKKEQDSFGNIVVRKGRNSKLVNYDVTIQKSKVGYVFNQLSQLTTIPSVYVGTTEADDSTLAFGYFRDVQINISSPTITDASIIVEGVV